MKVVAVCREAFIHVYGFSRTRLTLLHQSYKENGLMPPIRKRAGPSKHRLHLKHEDLQRVVNFNNNYAEDNAILLPGHHPGHKHFGGKLLPSHVTKAVVWRLYKESMTTLEVHILGLSSFGNLWRTLLLHISSTNPRTGIVKDSTVTGVNIPQPVGLGDGMVLVESYGWQQHLTLHFRPLPQIKQYQHFSFDALEPGVVAKERSYSSWDQVLAAVQC